MLRPRGEQRPCPPPAAAALHHDRRLTAPRAGCRRVGEAGGDALRKRGRWPGIRLRHWPESVLPPVQCAVAPSRPAGRESVGQPARHRRRDSGPRQALPVSSRRRRRRPAGDAAGASRVRLGPSRGLPAVPAGHATAGGSASRLILRTLARYCAIMRNTEPRPPGCADRPGCGRR